MLSVQCRLSSCQDLSTFSSQQMLHTSQPMTCCSRVQIFLTANPKLRSEVAKQFHRLRAAVLRDSEESRRLEELSKQDYSSLKNIPSDAFPLFWTTKQYLRAVDATLPEAPLGAGPFFPRYRLPAAADKICEEFRLPNLAEA